jgi:hypothetical protein
MAENVSRVIETTLASVRVVEIVTVTIAIVGTESGMRWLRLMLEGLAELPKGAVGGILGTCGGCGGVEVWSLLLAEV